MSEANLYRGLLLRYAMLGVPLGFLGLPLYMHLPHYYAEQFGVGLTALGGLFLFTRIADCAADPWLGRMLDRAGRALPFLLAIAAMGAAAGVAGLFLLPGLTGTMPALPLIGALLVFTYLCYSLLSIRLYAASRGLGSTPEASTRTAAWREALIVLGIVTAAALPGVTGGYGVYPAAFAVLLFIALLLGWRVHAHAGTHAEAPSPPLLSVVRRYWRLYGLFFLNALPPAMTATLYLFYVEDVLAVPDASAWLLLLYFMAAIVSMPLWVRAARVLGKRRSIAVAMLLAIGSFIWAAMLGPGDVAAFAIICVLTGVAFGGDAVLLPSLLSDRLPAMLREEGSAFGIWMAISKLTLAIAAGVSLPMVEWLGAVRGDHSDAIRFSYGLLPCLIKTLAFAWLLRFIPANEDRA